MTYRVVWCSDALESVALIWITADVPSAIRKMKDDLDLLLASNSRAGTQMKEGHWALDFETLRVLYEVDDQKRLVTVVSANPIERK